MNRVIVESPYAPAEGRTTDYHVSYARHCVRHSLDQGEAPMASHLLYTQPGTLDDTVPAERDRGVQAGYEWMQAADKVAFYVDYGWSPGMLRALKMARILGKPIEARNIHGRAITAIGEALQAAGVVEVLASPVPGVQVFGFRRD